MAGERKTGVKAAAPSGGRASKAVSARAEASTAAGTPAALASSIRSQTRALERLDASTAASTARVEQALQGLAMRVELLESATEDAIRALRELQSTVGGIPVPASGFDPATIDRWSAEQADAVRALEKQVVSLSGQIDSLRRRIPVRGRPERGPTPEALRLDPPSVAAIARAVADLLAQ